VSRLPDQVEAKIARANRAFRLSSRIVAAARDDLDGHGEWLDRHRVTWAEEVKRQRRVLNRKLTTRALTRSVAGLVFAAPFALWRALALKGNGGPSRVSRGPRRDEPANGSAHAPRHRIIRGLDGPLCTMKPARLRPAQREIESRKGPSSLKRNAVSPGLAGQERESRRKRPVSVLGLIALCLIAAGAVRATLSSPTGEAPALAAKKARSLLPPAAETSITVPKTPRPVKRPTAISGSVILARPSQFEPVQMPPRTVADMASISRPLALASPEPESAPIAEKPVAAKPVVAKPAVKPKPKRKLARRQPQSLPWWQQWSWIRLR